MSNDPDQEYFSDGIAEELLNVLARYPGLQVAARTSSFQFKGRNLDVADIARQLRVNHVLEGSVRKSGSRVRITAQLIEAEAGYHLWSETYDRELTDVFAIQDEISAAIGDALQVTLALAGGGGSSPTVPRSANPQAFEAFAAGRRLVHLRGRENLEQAVHHLQESLSLDPAYAPAHAQLAIAYVMLADAPGTYGNWPFKEAAARARPHIERARALDSGLAESFGARALLALNEADYDVAIREATAALEVNPSYSDALNWLFIAYQNTGRYKEAYDALTDLVRIDPISIPGRSNAAKYLARTGRLAEGIAMADNIAERNPAFSASTRGQIAYDVQGELAEALRWFLSGLKQAPTHRSNNSYAAFLFGMVDLIQEALRTTEDSHQWAWYAHGDWPEAIAYLESQLEATPSSVTWRYRLGRILFMAGRVDEACVLFEQLLSEAGGRPLFSEFYTAMPTAWAAFGRQQSGDDAGAALLIGMVEQDQAALERSGERLWWYYKTAALVAVLKGQDERALEQLQRAVEAGGVERTLLEDPVFARLSTRPEFKALEERVTQRRAAERAKVLHMLCDERPTDIAWQPLPETCAGLERGP